MTPSTTDDGKLVLCLMLGLFAGVGGAGRPIGTGLRSVPAADSMCFASLLQPFTRQQSTSPDVASVCKRPALLGIGGLVGRSGLLLRKPPHRGLEMVFLPPDYQPGQLERGDDDEKVVSCTMGFVCF